MLCLEFEKSGGKIGVDEFWIIGYRFGDIFI